LFWFAAVRLAAVGFAVVGFAVVARRLSTEHRLGVSRPFDGTPRPSTQASNVLPIGATPPGGTDLASLTGVRSGKRSYYREFRRSSERLEVAVRSLDQISLALVRTVEGPRALLTAVLYAAAEHLQARWLVLAVADHALPGARPRFLAVDSNGRLADHEDHLPAHVRAGLDRLRHHPPLHAESDREGYVTVPMTIDGQPVGGIAGQSGLDYSPEPMDLSVVRILVNQAAVALHSAYLYHSSLLAQTRAEQLTVEASQHARDLAARSQELQSAQQLLTAARERETLDAERHRISRELHDSVTQYVLSAGMAVDVCRSELERLGPEYAAMVERLGDARDLTQHAVGQLRTAIYALNRATDDETPVLPRLLEQACTLHTRPGLAVDLRLEGSPVPMPVAAEQSLSRVAGEALFNVSAHSGASRCVVRLSYRWDAVRLTVDDDGTGDPAVLRTLLRVAAVGDVDGRHRGLVNMAARAEELGGVFTMTRSRLGGVRTQVKVPLRTRHGEGPA
jgi:signal transduction histidine kinase